MKESIQKELNRLLKKKKPTGQEVGRLLVRSHIVEKVKHQDTISAEDLEDLVSRLTPSEGEIFTCYADLCSVVIQFYNYSQTVLQEMIGVYNRFYEPLLSSSVIQHARIEAHKKTPLIMTPTQYKRERAAKVQALEASKGPSAFRLILHALEYYSKQLEENPNVETPLHPFEASLEAEALPEPLLKEYISDDLQTVGFRKDVDDLEKENFLSQFISDFLFEIKKTRYKTGQSVTEIVNNLLLEHGYGEIAQPSKKAVLPYAKELFEYETETEAEEKIALFNDTFPGLGQALLQDISQRYSNLADVCSENPADWATVKTTFKTLCESGFYDFEKTVLSDKALFGRSVAFLPADSDLISENGNYEDFDALYNMTSAISIESFLSDTTESRRQELIKSQEYFANDIYFLNGFNAYMDLLIDLYQIDEAYLLKNTEAGMMKIRAEAVNKMIFSLYEFISEDKTKGPAQVQHEIKLFKETYHPIEWEQLETPKEKIAEAKRQMRNIRKFDSYSLFSTLCNRKRA